MFEAMRVASLLHKLQTADPRAVGAATALEMATMGGARALGMERRIGSLERGQARRSHRGGCADARQTPLYDPVSHLVYTDPRRRRAAPRGQRKVLMRDRKVLTLDTAAVLAEARAWGEKVRAAVR